MTGPLQITPEILERARQVRDALDAALRVMQSGAVTAAELGALPRVTVVVTPTIQPSPGVAADVAAAEEARQRFQKETDVARAVAIVLGVAAEVARAIAPALLALL